MSTRYDAIAVRKYEDRDGNEKSSFTNIGVAWPMKERDGFRVVLHAMPAPVNGEFTVLLMPPKERDDRPAQAQRRQDDYAQASGRSARPAPRREVAAELDDEIPF